MSSPTATKADTPNTPDVPQVGFSEFAATFPPNRAAVCSDFAQDQFFIPPRVQLHCPTCDKVLWFETSVQIRFVNYNAFLVYTCSNCQTTEKVFAVAWLGTPGATTVIKYGEAPPFGPRIPPRLVSLIGPDRDVLLMGRRAESQGMGIGAFAYYRRVVENQKARLFDEMVKVARVIQSPSGFIEQLERAKHETQFTKAVDTIKAAIPDGFKIHGQNPLLLLHDALSQGIHDLPDDQCLALATAVRVVLTELVERMAELRRENDALKQALSVLSNRKATGT